MRTCGGAGELMARDKAPLDTFYLRDVSLEDADNLPEPECRRARLWRSWGRGTLGETSPSPLEMTGASGMPPPRSSIVRQI